MGKPQCLGFKSCFKSSIFNLQSSMLPKEDFYGPY